MSDEPEKVPWAAVILVNALLMGAFLFGCWLWGMG